MSKPGKPDITGNKAATLPLHCGHSTAEQGTIHRNLGQQKRISNAVKYTIPPRSGVSGPFLAPCELSILLHRQKANIKTADFFEG